MKTRICSKLYMGGFDDLLGDLSDFKLIVLCAQELQARDTDSFQGLRDLLAHKALLRAPLDDAPWAPDPEEVTIARNAASVVAAHVRQGRRVLVTCAQGRNRSGLVAALALHNLTGASGHACAAYVRHMREQQLGPNKVLVNPHFVALLTKIPGHALPLPPPAHALARS